MKNTKIKDIAVVILALMLASSLAMLALLANNAASAQDDDVLQYDWPQGGYNESNTGFNPGPAPDRPIVRWKVLTPGGGMVSVFDGKAFVVQGQMIGTLESQLHAFDAFTGERLWTAVGNVSISGVSGVSKLDDTYLFGETTTGMTVIRIADGEIMWEKAIPNGQGHPGSGTYFAGQFSESTKMHFAHAWDASTNQAQILAYNLSNPAVEPPLEWTFVADTPSEMLCSGDGKLFLGSTEATVYAIDIMTGQRLWETHTLGGLVQQSAIYYNGSLYTSAVSTQMTCFDGETGEIRWQYEKGPRAFSAYRGAAAYGMIFDSTIEVDPHGYVRAWDANTGALLWRQPAYFNIAYTTIAVADGKVYSSTCDQAPGTETAGLVMPGYETTCFDAFTGTVLWKLRGINFAQPSVAYGNLYGLYGGYLYCIGGEPADWTHGFHGNVENPRVAVGQPGPANISTPRWTYQTGGDVSSSPAVVDGKVYVGSHDRNWYCLNAYTGEKIWNYTVGFRIRTSAAVVGGRMFTGNDDGYFYCFNAETGQKIWETSAGGHFPNLMVPTEFEPRSSPIVISDRIYVGSLDGNVYCLSTGDGDVLWTYQTGGPIMGSPVYSFSDDTIYIASTDQYLYALYADGTLKWRSMPLNLDVGVPTRSSLYNIGTPNVADGLVFIGGGVQYGTALYPESYYIHRNMSYPSGAWGGTIRFMAFNAATGASVWNLTRAGNTQPGYLPVYWNGQIYAPEYFVVTSMDALNPNSGQFAVPDFGEFMGARLPGNRTWGQWLGYQITSSAAYADDITGPKVYIGSDIGSVSALDASNGNALSAFATRGNVPCSPAIWDGKLYVGSIDGNVYCFDDAPIVSTTIFADANKVAEMWNNETLLLCGQLFSNPNEMTWNQDSQTYQPVSSDLHPALTNATVRLSVLKPDMTEEILTTRTDNNGYFNFSYSPTEVGNWGWVVYYEGETKPSLTYAAASGEWHDIAVTTSTPGGEIPAPPTLPTIPPEYIYGAGIALVLAAVAALAYVYLRRRR